MVLRRLGRRGNLDGNHVRIDQKVVEMTGTAMRFDFGPEFDANAAALKLAAAAEALADAKAEARHQAIEMSEHGRSEEHIAVRLGVTRRTVRRWLGRSAR